MMKVAFSKSDLMVGIRRLNILANYLRGLQKGNFDLSSWATHNSAMRKADGEYVSKPLKEIVTDVKEGACGTAACACGHATMIPAFRKAGLKLSWETGDEKIAADLVFTTKDSVYWGLDAAQMFFKLSFRDAEQLFMSYSYKVGSKTNVARRIDSMVRKMERELDKREAK